MIKNTPPRLFKCILLILSVLLVSKANAQEISVSSFQLLENDLTANTYGTMQKDHNGEVAALIKIPTTVQGFTFDGGMVGIVKTEQHVGEIWVYVPHGIKRISIFHQQLGYLRDYYFPIPIDKARTYEMKVVTAQVQTITNVTVQQQFVVFQVQPTDASVEINDEILIVNEQGMATKRLPYGRYNYRVSSPNYHTQAGVLEVNAESKAMVQVDLKPNFGWIDLQAYEAYHGAYVYLDGQRIGQLPMKTEALKSGSHRLRVMKSSYKVWEQDVTVSDNETTQLVVQLQSSLASVTLLADENCEIWLDGEQKGVGQCTLNLEPGEYKAEARRAGYQSSSILVQVTDTESKSFTLPAPVALYGSMEILSFPMGATVYLDEAHVGETPLLLNNILVGTHQLRFESDGYASLLKTVEVAHSQTASLNVSMEKGTSKAKIEKPKKEEPKPEPQKEEPKKEPKKQIEAKTPLNLYHTQMALYAGAALQLNDNFVQTGFPKTLHLGANFKGINVEYNYCFSTGFVYQAYDIRVGYALPLAGLLTITPQVGYGAETGFDAENGDYGVLEKGVVLAAPVRCCLMKNLALTLTPSFASSMGADFRLKAGLVYNFSLKK